MSEQPTSTSPTAADDKAVLEQTAQQDNTAVLDALKALAAQMETIQQTLGAMAQGQVELSSKIDNIKVNAVMV